jgi:hypothetical protein
MDMDDSVGGLAGAMMSPAAFGIAKWGQRIGPFVGPMKSAMGFDVDEELGQGRCQIPPNCRIVKTCSEYDARCRHLTCNSEPPNREVYARGCGPVSVHMPWGVWVIPGEEEDSLGYSRNNAPFNTFADEDDSVGNANLQHILSDHCGTMCRHNRDEDDSVGNAPRPRPRDI